LSLSLKFLSQLLHFSGAPHSVIVLWISHWFRPNAGRKPAQQGAL
jgi:hypothetical protein